MPNSGFIKRAPVGNIYKVYYVVEVEHVLMLVESSKVEVRCVVMVESSDGGVESHRVESKSCVVIVESIVMLVASSRVKVSCVVMVQYSCDAGGGGVSGHFVP